MTMKWAEVASGIYYVGVGFLLMATSIRFLYRFIRDVERKHDFIDKLQKDVPRIKLALIKICNKLNLDLDDEDDPRL